MDHVPVCIVDTCAHTRTLHTHACPCVSLSSSGLAAECPEACSSAKAALGSRRLKFPKGAGEGVQRGKSAARPRRLGAWGPSLGH